VGKKKMGSFAIQILIFAGIDSKYISYDEYSNNFAKLDSFIKIEKNHKKYSISSK
jgi:hypothetical protein